MAFGEEPAYQPSQGYKGDSDGLLNRRQQDDEPIRLPSSLD
jgi:hypothetical protein